jgi:hypothetical protein
MASCSLTFETLTDYVDGRLSPEAASTVEGHLQTACPRCAERLQWLRAVLPSLPEAMPDTAPVPSTQALENVHAMSRLLSSTRRPSGVIQHIAQLLTSVSQRTPVGARGESGSGSQVYETERHLVTLWSESAPENGTYLIGQVYEREGGPIVPQAAELIKGDGTSRLARQDGTEFHLPFVEPGVYILLFALEGEEIILPRLQIGEIPQG